jgi:hypothetical protein
LGRGKFALGGLWRSKLRGGEIRPTSKAFDVILTGNYGVPQYGILEMTNKFEEQAWGDGPVWGLNRDVHAKIFISEIVEKGPT